MGLLDFIFPKRCVSCGAFGSYICENCGQKITYLENQICPYCYKQAIGGATHPRCLRRLGLDGVISLSDYRGPIKEVIKSLKYRFNTDLAEEFSKKFHVRTDLILDKEAVLTPLPLSSARENYRGFNQAEILGRIVAEKLKLKYRDDLLERTKMAKPQVGLSQRQREKNVENVFRVRKNLLETNYFVFDDVWTSGASLKEVAAVLKKAGAKKVWGLTLAHPR